MEIIETILFIIAYTLGIAALIVQVICYMKKMEYFTNVAFSISFLLLIVSVSAIELNFALTAKISNIVNEAITLSMLLVALTTPLNIHQERIVKFAPVANKIIYAATSILFIFYILSYFLGFKDLISTAIKIFMFASVGYSMTALLSNKPGMLNKQGNKIEKITSIIFFSIFPIFIALDIFYDQLKFIHPYIPEGSYILLIFFIYLTFITLLEGIRRLTLFNPGNSINQNILARYGITPRESEVLSYIIKGKSYIEISELLFISLPTVKTHISRVYKKMNINNKVELINLLNQN